MPHLRRPPHTIFGEAIGVIGGVERKIHFFVFDLPHSDACFVVCYPASGAREARHNRAELKEFRDMLVAIPESVAVLKKQGRSRDETVAAKPTAAFDAKWGNFVIDPGFFTLLVYEGV